MTDHRYYVVNEKYSSTDKNGHSIDVSIGDQFVLLEDLQNDNLRLKSLDKSLPESNEVILPRRILGDLPKPTVLNFTQLLRSQSSVKERICSLNLSDSSSVEPEKQRFSTFGHEVSSGGMSRSTHESNRCRTLPSTVASKERYQQDGLVNETQKNEKVEAEPVAVMRKSKEDSNWKVISENGQDLHVNVNTGERWCSTIDESGRQYFYNESSRQSTWKLPDDNNHPLERSYGDEVVRPIDDVIENEEEFSDGELSDTNGTVSTAAEVIPVSPVTSPTVDCADYKQDSGSRFNIRNIKKEYISGPLFNKLMRTERTGTCEKIKVNENGRVVTKKWNTCHIVLTGPELLFYKDLKAAIVKPGMPQGKTELRLKIQNLHFVEYMDSGVKTGTLQVEDKGAPGSNITYLLRFSSLEDMRVWQVALQYAKDWQNEDMYSENTFSADPAMIDDPTGDIQNIGIKLKHFLKRRPTRESLEARGILKPESVFGSTLDILCEQERSKVPEFVFRCILAIEARGLQHNGLYRVSGNQANIQKLRLAVDENKYQLNSESMELETLTGALKSFFKELKEPLFDEEFCTNMAEILTHRKSDKKNPYRDVNIGAARKLIGKLRPCHYETAKTLIIHLHKVAAYSSKNLMDVSNLAMVWGPNLYAVSGQASTKLAVILMTHNQILDFLITFYAELFDEV